MEALGDGLGGVDGLGFGFAVGDGDGDSSLVAGLLAWNGVDAASCARTRTVETNNKIPITNERIITFFYFRADASVHASAGSRAIQSRFVRKSKWTQRGLPTKSSFRMKNLGAPIRSWR
jgi:hypothetical protein